MRTQCPQCQQILPLTAAQLKAHGGQVRCGECGEVFNAVHYLLVEDEAAVPELYAQPPRLRSQAGASSHAEPYLDDSAYEHWAEDEHEPMYRNEDEHEPMYRDEDEGIYRDDEDAIYLADGEAVYRDDDAIYLHKEERRRSRRRGVWGYLSLLAFVALVLQISYVFRHQIAHAQPALRPVLQGMCAVMGCDLLPERHLEQLRLDDSRLTIASGVRSATDETPLRLRATLINDGERPTAWPSIILTLKDSSGKVERRRIIRPEAYVPAAMRATPMPAQMQYPIDLSLILQGAMASNFELVAAYITTPTAD